MIETARRARAAVRRRRRLERRAAPRGPAVAPARAARCGGRSRSRRSSSVPRSRVLLTRHATPRLPKEADKTNVVVDHAAPSTGRILVQAAPWKGHDGICYVMLFKRAACVPRTPRGTEVVTPPIAGYTFDSRVVAGTAVTFAGKRVPLQVMHFPKLRRHVLPAPRAPARVLRARDAHAMRAGRSSRATRSSTERPRRARGRSTRRTGRSPSRRGRPPPRRSARARRGPRARARRRPLRRARPRRRARAARNRRGRARARRAARAARGRAPTSTRRTRRRATATCETPIRSPFANAPAPRAAHQRRPSAGAETTPQHELAVALEREQRRPHRDAAREVPRAVDRVDDPADRRRRRRPPPRRARPRRGARARPARAARARPRGRRR